MTLYTFATADCFTDRIFGGNQLAVFPDARGLGDAQMQAVAREFNYSETVFVFPPRDPAHTRQLRIFTPAAEIPFAGHPTVGAAFVLATLGDIAVDGDETRIVFEEGVGPVPVVLRRAASGAIVTAQLTVARLPEIGPPAPSRGVLAEILSIDATDVLGGMSAPQAVSCGLPFLIVPLKDRAAVAQARVRPERYAITLARYWAPNVMVFARETEREGVDIRARVFVPELAILEDPATGSAAASLGGYLAARDPLADGTLRWTIEQGIEMGRPSRLDVEADKAGGQIVAIRVGGAAVMVSRGEMEIPATDD